MPFEVPPLPYDYAALEPHIDVQTMQIHHDKHHAAYVTNLNTALQGQSQFENMTVENILRQITTVPENIRTVSPQQCRRTCQPHDVLGDHDSGGERTANW